MNLINCIIQRDAFLENSCNFHNIQITLLNKVHLKRFWSQTTKTSHQEDLNSQFYSKINFSGFCLCYLGLFLSKCVEDISPEQLFLVKLYLFDFIFIRKVRIFKLRHCFEGIFLHKNRCNGNEKKKQYFHNSSDEDKIFHQKN